MSKCRKHSRLTTPTDYLVSLNTFGFWYFNREENDFLALFQVGVLPAPPPLLMKRCVGGCTNLRKSVHMALYPNLFHYTPLMEFTLRGERAMKCLPAAVCFLFSAVASFRINYTRTLETQNRDPRFRSNRTCTIWNRQIHQTCALPRSFFLQTSNIPCALPTYVHAGGWWTMQCGGMQRFECPRKLPPHNGAHARIRAPTQKLTIQAFRLFSSSLFASEREMRFLSCK